MPSSKGEPDNPKLREEVKAEVKAMSKGGGPNSWSAWKAGELAKRYEARGGGYIDSNDGHKNKSQKGPPEPKDPKDKKENAAEKNKREKEEREKKDERKEKGEKNKK